MYSIQLRLRACQVSKVSSLVVGAQNWLSRQAPAIFPSSSGDALRRHISARAIAATWPPRISGDLQPYIRAALGQRRSRLVSIIGQFQRFNSVLISGSLVDLSGLLTPISNRLNFVTRDLHKIDLEFSEIFMVAPLRYQNNIRISNISLLFSNSNIMHTGVGKWIPIVEIYGNNESTSTSDSPSAAGKAPRLKKGVLHSRDASQTAMALQLCKIAF